MRAIVLGIALVAAGPVPVAVHHSFAAYYFEEQSVTIEGAVKEFDLRAPHAWLHLQVPDAAGVLRTYSAEWANPNRLARDNITAETLRPGDVVRVSGSPGRKREENRIHLKSIERPSDGWKWSGGGRRTPPRGR
jgi:hypothetical protein